MSALDPHVWVERAWSTVARYIDRVDLDRLDAALARSSTMPFRRSFARLCVDAAPMEIDDGETRRYPVSRARGA